MHSEPNGACLGNIDWDTVFFLSILIICRICHRGEGSASYYMNVHFKFLSTLNITSLSTST